MKKTVLFFLMIILIASCHQEEIPSVSDKPEGNQLIFDFSGLYLCETERRTYRRGADKEYWQHGKDRN